MHSLDIQLRTPESIRAFVNLTNRYPFYILLQQGSASIDAKSLLGICSLDPSRPAKLIIYSDRCQELVDELQPYLC